MASIFKRKRKVRLSNGKAVVRQSLKYYTRLRDANGVKRTIPLFIDKTASQQQAAQLQKEIELTSAELVDKYREHRQKPLSEHLAEFRQFLLDKGDTEDYTRLTHNRIERLLNGCKFMLVSEVSPSRIQRYLAERRQSGLSVKSCNYYLTAIKGFFNWMVDDKRLSENPIIHLKGLNAKVDIRHLRRSLEPDEIRRLLETTAVGPERFGMSGYERSLIYRFATETGLRAREIRTLTVGSFDFDKLCVTVKAGYSKHRREDTQPLRKDTSVLLKDFFLCGGKLPTVKAFGGRYNQLTKRTSDMIKADLADAGIPYIDEAGRYADFHALRHSFASILHESGVSPKIAQALLRHSTIGLTMDTYTHIGLYSERDAIEGLPDLSLPSGESQRASATGTDTSAGWTPKRTPLSPFVDNHTPTGMGRSGFEPPTHGFSVRCSTN